MENHKISIVIPLYNKWHLAHQLLFDIYKNCKSDVEEVVCVDDGSTDLEVQEGLNWWSSNKMLPINLIRMTKNLGFIEAVNLGMAQAFGDIKIVISNDVRVHRPFVCDIVSILDKNPKTLVGNTLRDYDTGWNKFGDRLFPYIEGWIFALTAEAWEDIGGFDICFKPNDYEDVDLSTTAVSKGYSLVSLHNDGIVHLGAQTIGYNDTRLALTERNRDIFGEKWLKK